MSVLFTWGDDDEKSIGFDIILSYNYSGESTPTSYAVEEGANVSDHIDTPLPPFTFEAFISNTPLRPASGEARLQKYGGEYSTLDLTYRTTQANKVTKTIKPPKNRQIPGIVNPVAIVGAIVNEIVDSSIEQPWIDVTEVPASQTVRVLQFASQFDLVQECLDTLEEIRSNGLLLTCYTPHKAFAQCTLTKYELQKTKETGPQAGKLQVTVHPIRIVTTKEVPRPDPTQGRTLPVAAKGVQPPAASTFASVISSVFGLRVPTASVPVKQ